MGKEQVAEKAKWYDKGWGFEPEDVVFIELEHPHVGGRFAVVKGPSEKENCIKAHLQHPKNGEAQNSQVVLKAEYLTLVTKGGFGEPVLKQAMHRFEMDATGIYAVAQELAKAQ